MILIGMLLVIAFAECAMPTGVIHQAIQDNAELYKPGQRLTVK